MRLLITVIEPFGWFDAQAASHIANTTNAIVFFKKISPVSKKSQLLDKTDPMWFQRIP